MAPQQSEQEQQAEQHRADLAALVALALVALADLWRRFAGPFRPNPVDVRDELIAALPEIVAMYAAASGSLGADWYDELRQGMDIPGGFRAVTGGLPDESRPEVLARWGTSPLFKPLPQGSRLAEPGAPAVVLPGSNTPGASATLLPPSGGSSVTTASPPSSRSSDRSSGSALTYTDSRGPQILDRKGDPTYRPAAFIEIPGHPGEPTEQILADADLAATKALIEGGLQRIIVDAARESSMTSAVADPEAEGWQRVGSGDGDCGFCSMLIARGFVYRSEKTAAFGAHDNCDCLAVPAWGGQPLPVRQYKPTSRRITDADRKRARQWMRDNGLL